MQGNYKEGHELYKARVKKKKPSLQLPSNPFLNLLHPTFEM
jgi:hypothetical protein